MTPTTNLPEIEVTSCPLRGHDLTRKEIGLLRRMGFYEWGGGHWCAEFDGGETCYNDSWAVEEAIEYAKADNLPACGECKDYWPALKGDYLCSEHRRLVKNAA